MKGSTVLITGAGRGIGLALAGELARCGWRVLAGARDPAGAHDLHTAAQKAAPGRIDVLPLDVCSDESAKAAAKEAATKLRAIDVLVNNAGVFPEEGNETLEELPLECFAEAFAVNVVGVARVTRAFSPCSQRLRIPAWSISAPGPDLFRRKKIRGITATARRRPR